MDRTAIRKVDLHEAETDAAYWRSRPPQERLAALESIRREYHDCPPDFREFAACANARDVRYLIVGGARLPPFALIC